MHCLLIRVACELSEPPIAAQANRVLGANKKSITSSDSAVIIKLYKSLVRPNLEYTVQTWRPYLKLDADSREKVQGRFTKLISGMEKLSHEN